jgi:site-specific DNA-methyltransferase (adenine-specific)
MADDVRLMLGDCLERMGEVPDGSIDLVLADLPYGTTACQWDQVIPLGPLWAHYRRLLKPTGAVVLTASQPFTTDLIGSNREWFRCEWIWEKSNGGGSLNANRQPLKRHESVLVFAPAQPTYHPQKAPGKPYRCRSAAAGETTQDQAVAGWITRNDGDRYPTSVIRFPSETGSHPTQKPVALGAYLIRTYTDPGAVILDNAMGSGSFGVAAIEEGRSFIGIESAPGYFAVAGKRIAGARPAMPLFAGLDPIDIRPEYLAVVEKRIAAARAETPLFPEL